MDNHLFLQQKWAKTHPATQNSNVIRTRTPDQLRQQVRLTQPLQAMRCQLHPNILHLNCLLCPSHRLYCIADTRVTPPLMMGLLRPRGPRRHFWRRRYLRKHLLQLTLKGLVRPIKLLLGKLRLIVHYRHWAGHNNRLRNSWHLTHPLGTRPLPLARILRIPLPRRHGWSSATSLDSPEDNAYHDYDEPYDETFCACVLHHSLLQCVLLSPAMVSLAVRAALKLRRPPRHPASDQRASGASRCPP